MIVFTTTGKHFSAGHDMSGSDPCANGRSLRPKRAEDGKLVAEDYYDWETRGYLEYAKRWRDIPKPSIAAVQGKCIAAGLMLCWPCDLIVAADNAQFSDPVGMLGIMGVEYHAHTWELGPSKAKEMLFTQNSVSAERRCAAGWSTTWCRWTSLRSFTMELAHRVAQTDPGRCGWPSAPSTTRWTRWASLRRSHRASTCITLGTPGRWPRRAGRPS